MTAKDDLAAKLVQFEQQMAASEKRVAELEAKIAEAAKVAKPLAKSDYTPPDYTRNATMAPSVVREMTAAVDDRLMADLRGDALKPNPVTQGTSVIPPSSSPGQVERGTGWRDQVKIGPPPGIKYVDAQVDAQDVLDRQEAERRWIWGKKG